MFSICVHKNWQRKRIFVAFLLLGGLVHFLNRKDYAYVPDTLIYCVNFAIYAGLILYWIQSVRDRLTRSPSRCYALAAGGDDAALSADPDIKIQNRRDRC